MFWSLNIFMIIIVFMVVMAASFDAERILNASFYTPLLMNRGQLLDLRSVADLVHRELNNEDNRAGSNLRYRGQVQQQPTVQEIRNMLNSRPLRPLQPHLIQRILMVVRGFMRAFGVKVWHYIWQLPRPRVPNILQQQQNKNESETEDEDEELA